MNVNHKYTSIAAVFVSVALMIYQIRAQTAYEDEISTLKQSQLAALQTSRDTIAQLQKTVANMSRQLQGMQTTVAAAGNHQPASVTGPNGATITIASAPANDQAAMQERIRSMMSSPAMRAAAAKIQVNAVYGDFIRGLHLNAADKESLAQIFAGAMNQKTDLNLKLAQGALSKADYEVAVKNIDDKLRDSLAGYLYKDEMTAFDQYEATKDARAAAKLVENQELQLQNAVPDLTPQARKYVARVLAEETSKTPPTLLPGTNGDPNARNVTAVLEARNQQMDQALQRMQSDGALDKNQLSAVEDYINQQKAMQDMMGQMANTFLKK